MAQRVSAPPASGAVNRAITERVLNVRLPIGTALAVLILGTAAYFVHASQIRRISSAFLQRAGELEAVGNWDAAANHLYRYLRIYPDDADVRVRLAQVFDRSALDPARKIRAVELYYRAVSIAPEEQLPEVRRRLARLLLDVRRFAAAETEAARLVESKAHGTEGQALLALALYGEWHAGTLAAKSTAPLSVGQALIKALELNPGDIELSGILAQVYRQDESLLPADRRGATSADRAREADRIINAMIQAHPRSAEAFLVRYQYRANYQLPGAAEDLDAAMRLAPDHPAGLLLAAEHAMQEAAKARRGSDLTDAARKDCEQARQYYQRFLKRVSPTDEQAYLGLGNVAFIEGDWTRAVEAWREGLRRIGRPSVPLNLRIAEALLAASQPDEAEKAIQAAERALAQLRSRMARSEELALTRSSQLVRAAYFLKTERPADAVPLLREVANNSSGSAQELLQSAQAAFLLGQALGALNQWDQAVSAFERTANLQPRTPAPLLAAGSAALQAGQRQRSAQFFETALAYEDNPETWLSLATARLQVQLVLPAADRDWEPFEQALAKARNAPGLADPWRLLLLQTDRALASGDKNQTAAAAQALRQGEERQGDSVLFLGHLARAYERLGSPADADRAVDRLARRAPQSATAPLLRAALLAGRNQFEPAREALRSALKTLPPEARSALEFGQVQVSLLENNLDRARKELVSLHEKNPNDATLVRQLGELALESRDFAGAQRWETRLGELTDRNGLDFRFFRARRLVGEAESVSDPRFREAEQLQSEFLRERPNWAPGYALSALVQQRKGNVEDAIRAYQEALRLGDRRVSVYEQLVLLLYQTQRIDEAQRYLAELQTQPALTPALSALEVSLATKQGQLERAIALARQATQRAPKDLVAWIMLGNVLAAAQQGQQAEAALRQAAALAPEDPRPYLALLTFYAQLQQSDRARQLLQQLSGESRLPPLQKALLLAQGSELLNDTDRAKAAYQEAVRLAPQSVDLLVRFADFLVQRDPREAEKLARRALELAPGTRSAERVLAAVLAERGGEKEWREAMDLLARSGADQGETLLNQRLQAMLLLRRGQPADLTAARQILERELRDPAQARDGDRLLLARVYEAQNNLARAREQYELLMQRPNPDPVHVGLYADLLVRHGVWPEAEVWLKRLEQSQPDALETLSLRARWLHGQGRDAEISPRLEPAAARLVKEAGDNRTQRAQLALSFGNIYSAVSLGAQAERWFRLAVEAVPESYQAAATTLATHGRMGEAIRFCLEASAKDSSAKPATLLATLLLGGKPSPQDLQSAESLLTRSLEAHRGDATFLMALANLRLFQQRSEDAGALYRQVLALQPRNALAMNNLAAILAEQPGKGPEAIQWIDRAIKIAGSDPNLLDTKAMALLNGGEVAEALPLLKNAAMAPRPDPRCLFHLALAYHRSGEKDKALAAWKDARSAGLARPMLTERDGQWFDDLEKVLGNPG